MPLSAPVARRDLHTRNVVCRGFFRDDGMWDIEGRITDEKHYRHAGEWRGDLEAGDYVHSMAIRLTIDESMTIRDVETVTDASPYRICPDVTPNFRRLIGLRITGGFHRQARERVGGTHGCTHIVELLGPVATTAYQTIGSDKARELMRAFKARQAVERGEVPPAKPKPRDVSEMRPPRVMDTCHAWASDGPVIKRWAPLFYQGPDGAAVRADAEARIRARVAAYDEEPPGG